MKSKETDEAGSPHPEHDYQERRERKEKFGGGTLVATLSFLPKPAAPGKAD